MATTGDSRLYRKLKPSQPLFQAYNSSTGTYHDDQIHSITITRGSDSPEPELAVNTCEYVLKGEVTDVVGARARVNLTAYGADLVAKMAGNITASAIQERFWGRTGIVSVTDRSPTRKQTTIASSGWIAMMKKSNYDPFISGGMKTGIVVARAANFQNVSGILTATTHGTFDAIVNNTPSDEKRTFEAVATRYGTDLGLQIREVPGVRQIQVWSIQARKDAITQIAKTAPHLTRSAAISPATHSQTLDMWNVTRRILTTKADGSQGYITFTPRADNSFLTVEEVDWSYVRRETEQISQYATAYEYRTLYVTMRPESITVDLLYLLTSPSEHHRHQAGYLLALQQDDPVFFSGDWQPYLRGMYIAKQIRETITPDAWRLELSLWPSEYILGDRMEEIWPKPQTWEAAGEMRWSDYTELWNEL
ncbi:hypothetical protein [Rothia sp. L_38]|uniref:hypothetical protein n=1 Tax=Rothia sp. L_38 TaxID=3422315 RepID=UPI003D6AA391